MDSSYFNILFLDIETAAQKKDYDEIPERLKPLWDKKASYLRNEEERSSAEMYTDRAAIYSEFGKVICIGVGAFYKDENQELCFKVKTLSADTEEELLQQFAELVNKHKAKNSLQLCAHNGKEFDFPYISRRMLVNGIKLPDVLNLSGKKPWEVNHIDTLELWKFGDYKKFTSLDLLAAIFDIPSSKSDITGADVNRVYHEENDLEKIKTYCGKDVAVLAQVFLKQKGLELIKEENLFFTK